ncbi:MAG: hypothetical protein AAFX76_11985, partial [Planctomycetota bacterium]
TDRPLMFSEWLHLPMGNHAEQDADPGIYDYFAVWAQAHMDYTQYNDHVLGGALFTGTPVTAIHEWIPRAGLYDMQRRVNDAHYHTMKAMSPVRLTTEGLPENPGLGVARFDVEHRGSFGNLDQYTFRYQQGSLRGEVSATSAGPGEVGTLEITTMGELVEPLDIDVVAPDGRVIDRYRFESSNGGVAQTRKLERFAGDTPLELDRTPEAYRVVGDGFSWTIDRETGLVREGVVGETVVVEGGPMPSLTNSAWIKNHRNGLGAAVQEQLRGWSAESVKASPDGDGVTVRVAGAFERAAVKMRYRFTADGGMTVGYEVKWEDSLPIDVFDAGLKIALPEAMEVLTWEREAFWSIYPDNHIGRPSGRTLATGDPRWAEARASWTEPEPHTEAGEPRPWPWSQDIVFEGVTRDFRSTKSNVRRATLTADDGGPGLAVLSDGKSQHLRIDPADGSYWMHVNPFWCGGAEFHQAKSIRGPVMVTEPGLVLKDQVEWVLLPGRQPGDTSVSQVSPRD